MPSELIIGGALANCGRDAPTDEFLEFLVRETPELAVYRLRPTQRPGWTVKAALDWQAILGTGADILAFAGLLWAAYERYVKPRLKQKEAGANPFLFINVRRPDGSFVQFSLGNEHTDKDMFIEQFTREVTELRETEAEGTKIVTTLSQSEDWVRLHVRDRDDS